MARWSIKGIHHEHYYIYDPDEPFYAIEIRRLTEDDWFIGTCFWMNSGSPVIRGPQLPANWVIYI